MAEEKNFENKIRKYITEKGGWCVKFFANGMTARGIPDLLCCINGRFVALEIKASRGRPSPLQEYQIEQIRNAGGLAFIVYPKDWEQMKEVLDGLYLL